MHEICTTSVFTMLISATMREEADTLVQMKPLKGMVPEDYLNAHLRDINEVGAAKAHRRTRSRTLSPSGAVRSTTPQSVPKFERHLARANAVIPNAPGCADICGCEPLAFEDGVLAISMGLDPCQGV